MRDNLVRFPKKHSRPELIDELKGSLINFYTERVPDCDVEKSLMATSIFHFLIASKIALDHLGKNEESSVILNAVKSIESTWPHYEHHLDSLLNELKPFCGVK